MFAIPNCSRSIGIQVLLAMAFGIAEFTVTGNTIPANKVCLNVSDEIICYFKASEILMNWKDAQHLCRSFDSTLLVIRNESDQVDVAGYLRSNINSTEVWTAGQNFTYSDWTWINGESFKAYHLPFVQENEVLADPTDVRNDNAAIERNFTFTTRAASDELPYICQYQAAFCKLSSDMNVNENCLRLISDSRSWYDARNQCLLGNGDLAVIGDAELEILKQLKLNQSYWIGLRKKSWRWTLNDDADSNVAINYTYWDNTFATTAECISILASEGRWKSVVCSELKTVVCQRDEGATSPTVTLDRPTSAATIHTFTPQAVTPSGSQAVTPSGSQAVTPSGSQAVTTSGSQAVTASGSQGSSQQTLLFTAVCVGIIVIICIIVIVVFVLRTKNGKNGQSKLNDGYAQTNGEELNTRISKSPVYTSINEPVDVSVDRSDDIRGVYADIALLTPEQCEDGGTNQQPGIVYASLDFNKDPTNQEPDKTHATSPTKVGPLGDIYAVPDAKGHAVTSPGGESSSHPVKVTPQGDVYAIPMKMSTSPTAKTPIAVVYANLQTTTLEKEQAAEDNDETK